MILTYKGGVLHKCEKCAWNKCARFLLADLVTSGVQPADATRIFLS